MTEEIVEKQLQLKKPIFLLCSERSGSNLIRVIVGNNSKVSAPTPPHFYNLLFSRIPLYGNLNEDNNFKKLCVDTINVLKNDISPWEQQFDPTACLKVKDRSLIGLMDFFYHREMLHTGGDRVFFKETSSHQLFYHFKEKYPDAYYIYMVRDGRDFALSFLNSPNHFGEIEDVARSWKEEQNAFLNIYLNEKHKGNIFCLNYEDLISFPEEMVKKLCNFLDLPYEEKMLEFHAKDKNKEAAQKVGNWSNIAKPVISNNFGKYKKGLSRSKITTFERIAHTELLLTGYHLERSVQELAVSSKRANRNEKIKWVLKKALRGRFISAKEIKTRQKKFESISEMKGVSDSLEPIMKCRAVDNSTKQD